MNQKNEVVIYQSNDGTIKVDVLFEGETVWLSQAQLCMLFGKSKSTISEHIKNIFEEGELNDERFKTGSSMNYFKELCKISYDGINFNITS